MDMSVAPLIDQLSVDDCPRSIVDGSAVKLAITGFSTLCGGGGVAVLSAGVRGGGGGGGIFFLPQPEANTNSINTSKAVPILEACDLRFLLMPNNLPFVV